CRRSSCTRRQTPRSAGARRAKSQTPRAVTTSRSRRSRARRTTSRGTGRRRWRWLRTGSAPASREFAHVRIVPHEEAIRELVTLSGREADALRHAVVGRRRRAVVDDAHARARPREVDAVEAAVEAERLPETARTARVVDDAFGAAAPLAHDRQSGE